MPHTPNYTYDYLGNALVPERIQKAVKLTCKLLNKYEFDGIAFRGMSGALIAPIVAFKLRKPLLMVRKPKHVEDQHSCYPVEGDFGIRTYVIIDDFISTGDTVRAIIQGIYYKIPEARCIGVAEVNHIVDARLYRGSNKNLTLITTKLLSQSYKHAMPIDFNAVMYVQTTPNTRKVRPNGRPKCNNVCGCAEGQSCPTCQTQTRELRTAD